MTEIIVKDILESAESLAPLKSQEDYAKQMAAFIKMHLTRVNAMEKGITDLPIFSIMVTGPTGVGKTYVISQLAKAAGVSFITIDCTSLSRTGWKGDNLNTVLYTALSKGDIDEGCIVCFDEFDKLRFGNPQYNDGNAQVNFLKLYDGTITVDHDRQTKTIDTSKMSFIYSGAFTGIKEQIQKHTNPVALGFCTTKPEEQEYKITMADIEEYGIMSELCGRIGAIYTVSEPTDEDYEVLIKGEKGSVQRRYVNLFKPYGVDFEISKSACTYVADIARKNHFGARAVSPLFQGLVQECMVEIDRQEDICKIIVDYNNDKQLHFIFEHDKNKRRARANNFFTNKTIYEDYNIASYRLTHRESSFIRTVIRMCPELSQAEQDFVRDFLTVSIYYIFNELNTEEWTLASIQKLAKATQLDDDGGSIFKQLVYTALGGDRWTNLEKTIAHEAFDRFRNSFNETSTRLLVKTIKSLRRRWYKELRKKV